MKAMLCREFGPIENIIWTELPAPLCGPKQVRFRTSVATLGFMDGLMVKGEYQIKPPLPYVPGSVSAGVVTEVGANVRGIRVGQRVTDKGQATQDNESPGDRAGDGDKDASDEGLDHETIG